MPKLSILICTLTDRRRTLARLLGVLGPQCISKDVVIAIKEDQRQSTIGEKRQKLLEEATGDYVCFVDDDDLVSKTYVDDILQALAATPDATHCSLRGVLCPGGQMGQQFEHSTKYREWTNIGRLYVRPPNHLNAIRRDLALQAGFTAKSFGEDQDFSMTLLQLGGLTREAWIEPLLYFYQTPAPVVRRKRRTVVVPPPPPPAAKHVPPPKRDWLGRVIPPKRP